MSYIRYFFPMINEGTGFGFKNRQPAGRSILESRGNGFKLTTWAQDLKPQVLYAVYLIFADHKRFAGVFIGNLPVDDKGKGEMRKEFLQATIGDFNVADVLSVAVITKSSQGIISPLCGYRDVPITWMHGFYEYTKPALSSIETENENNKDFITKEEAVMESTQVFKPEREPEREIEPKHEPEFENELQLEPERELEPQLEPEHEFEPQFESEQTNESESDPERENEPEHELERENEPELEPERELEPELEPKHEFETQPELEAQFEPKPETEPETEPIQLPDPEPEPTPQSFQQDKLTKDWVDNLPQGEMANAFREAVNNVHIDSNKETVTESAQKSNVLSLFETKPLVTPFQKQARSAKWIKFDLSDPIPPPANKPKLFKDPFIQSALQEHKHLLLGLTTDRGPCRYIIGVPGVYDQTSRQKAKQLGFIQFKCNNDTYPSWGESGYWLMFTTVC